MLGHARTFSWAFSPRHVIVLFMKTVSKIDPEKEYQTVNSLIELASQNALNSDQASNLDSSVDNLITAARILLEREARRRGHPTPPSKNPSAKGAKKEE